MNSHRLRKILQEFYDNELFEYQYDRYTRLVEKFNRQFEPKDDLLFFSSPGRIEISGNHTDHNNGKVLAAAINLDTIGVVQKNNDNRITVYSDGYEQAFCIESLDNLQPKENERGSTTALIRGIAAQFKKLGYNIGGFDCTVHSDVMVGSGLSSSASFELLIATIFNHLFNSGSINSVELAGISRHSENIYFGKPCGLMDQMAIAIGGIVGIDFKEPENPVVQKVEFDLDSTEYSIVIVDSGETHVDLTDDYSAIPNEMKNVAEYFNKRSLIELSEQDLLINLPQLRESFGDRSVLRAIHFFEENTRVEKQIDALAHNNFQEFINSVNDSGVSSSKYLQNIYSLQNHREQGANIMLALTELFLKVNGPGAARIHGGGFGGTILVFLKKAVINKYKEYLLNVFGQERVKLLKIRKHGSMYIGSNK